MQQTSSLPRLCGLVFAKSHNLSFEFGFFFSTGEREQSSSDEIPKVRCIHLSRARVTGKMCSFHVRCVNIDCIPFVNWTRTNSLWRHEQQQSGRRLPDWDSDNSSLLQPVSFLYLKRCNCHKTKYMHLKLFDCILILILHCSKRG